MLANLARRHLLCNYDSFLKLFLKLKESLRDKLIDIKYLVADSCLSMMTMKASRAANSRAAIDPIISKTELDNIQPDDPRHYQLVNAPDGYQSNAISYDPTIQY